MSGTIQERKPIAEQIEIANAGIKEVLAKCNPVALSAMDVLSQAATLSKGINMLRDAMTDEIMDRLIMPLQNSKLGFLTDRKNARDGQPKEYPRDVVREVMIEGMMLGLRPVGNEINIIGENCYGTKNGIHRLVREWPGLSNLHLTPGVPEMHGKFAKTALLSMRATWLLNGERFELYRGQSTGPDGVVDDTRFAIRVNDGMVPDAIVGKCERKMYAAILAKLSHGTMQIADGDATIIEAQGVTVSETPAAKEGQRMRMGKKRESPANADGELPMREPGED